MPLFIRQPIMGRLDAVTRFATPQRVVQFGGDGPLGALALGELVQRPVKVLALVDAPGIKGEMFGLALVRFLEIDRVVK
jgi:hypothetical protein